MSGGVPGKVLRIHGAWYDVSQFPHPGGPVAIALGYGRDATVLFESSHPFTSRSRLAALLQSCAVPPEVGAELERAYQRDLSLNHTGNFEFDFAPAVASLDDARAPREGFSTLRKVQAGGGGGPPIDPFEVEVKAIARQYFEAEAARRGVSFRVATKATTVRYLQLLVMAAAFIASAPLLVAGWWPAVVLTPTLLWLATVNYWHDATHFAMSATPLVNWLLTYSVPWFCSPLMWWHQHVIGHHSYTNLSQQDPDLYHADHVWRFQHTELWKPAHQFAWASTPIVWLLATPYLMFVSPVAGIVRGSFNAVVRMNLPAWRIILHITGRVLVFASLYGWQWWAFRDTPWKAAAFTMLPNLVFSYWFMLWSQVNHHAGELSNSRDARWYRHQMMTSHTIAAHSPLTFLFSGGLNVQAAHHLFPTVNHIHLVALTPLFEAAARKHGVPFLHSASTWEAVVRLWKHYIEMGHKPSDAALVWPGVPKGSHAHLAVEVEVGEEHVIGAAVPSPTASEYAAAVPSASAPGRVVGTGKPLAGGASSSLGRRGRSRNRGGAVQQLQRRRASIARSTLPSRGVSLVR